MKKKRAKSYKPRTINLNTMKVATNRQSILTDTEKAPLLVEERVNGRGIWSAKGTELVAITEGLERHELQLEFCSLNELRVAVDKVKRNVRAAREGRMSAVTIVAPSFDRELEAA